MLRRLIVYGLAVVVALLVAALATIYWFVSGDAMRLALEHQATAWLERPVSIGRVRVAWLPRLGIRLENVSATASVPIVVDRLDLALALRPLLERRVEAVRAIAIDGAQITSRGRTVLISGSAIVDGTRLAISRVAARSERTAIDAHGAVDFVPRFAVTLEAAASRLDIDELLALLAAFPAPGANGSGRTAAPRINVSISAPEAVLAGVPLARFEASLAGDGRDVRIEPLKFDLFGGRYDGWIDVTLGEQLDIRIGAGISNLDVARLSAFAGAPEAITGRLYGSGRFGLRAATIADAFATARGVGEAVVSDGAIRKLDVVGAAMTFLTGGDIASPGAGGRFQSIAATFALADDALRSDDLTLKAGDYDIFARGTLALSSKTIDGRANLALSPELSAKAGRAMTRYARAGNRIVLPARLSGTLAAPRISIDAGAMIRRGLQNEIERRLQDLAERVPAFD